MDGDQADAIGLVALDGLGVEVVVPLVEERVDIAGIVGDKVGELVVEGTEISALTLDLAEAEDGVEAFAELVEGQRAQGREGLDIVGGQEGIEVVIGQEQLVVGGGTVEDVLLPGLHDGGLGELVVGVYQEAQGTDDEADSTRGVEAEGFVGDDAHSGHDGQEMAGDNGDGGIVAHEDGDAALADVLGHKRGYDVCHLLEHALFIIGCGQQSDVYQSSVLALVGYQLFYVGIGLLELFGLEGTEFLLGEILELGGMAEEGVVERDDATLRTVVGLEVARLNLLLGELVLDAVEQSPIARAPTVDALLHVAHDEVGGVLVAHGLGEQHVEVAPLDGGGVLELVDHDVLYLGTYLLEDKGGVALADERVEQLLGVAEQESVVGLVEGVHLLFDAA